MRPAGSQGLHLARAPIDRRSFLLSTAAVAHWNVPAAECAAENGVISHPPSERKLTFGQVAAAAARSEPPKSVALKDPKDWTLIGTRQKRFDVLDKVTGQPIYGID